MPQYRNDFREQQPPAKAEEQYMGPASLAGQQTFDETALQAATAMLLETDVGGGESARSDPWQDNPSARKVNKLMGYATDDGDDERPDQRDTNSMLNATIENHAPALNLLDPWAARDDLALPGPVEQVNYTHPLSKNIVAPMPEVGNAPSCSHHHQGPTVLLKSEPNETTSVVQPVSSMNLAVSSRENAVQPVKAEDHSMTMPGMDPETLKSQNPPNVDEPAQQQPLPNIKASANESNGVIPYEAGLESNPIPELPVGHILQEDMATAPGPVRDESDMLLEVEGGFKSRAPSAPDATSERRSAPPAPGTQPTHPPTLYGLSTPVEAKGHFPAPGSVLGDFFCLGRLGKGTFSSIHKCINLNYYPEWERSKKDAGLHPLQRSPPQLRLAAAKVELSSFEKSGVLEGEATILDFLYRSLPKGTVPVYMGLFKSDPYAAILMEYLPGTDLHFLRQQVTEGSTSRRIALEDAVYLTAEVMLPLLKHLHEVGVVHRDVKPSNVVRSDTTSNKQFCLVDFGLSKSIVFPETSDMADREHVWQGNVWLKPPHFSGAACYRKERKNAEFRGTSMYASLRIHQGRDYCPRDDIWSLLYVFCDLVSGGLPWMSYAANKDRAACQKLKERVHGDDQLGADETEQLLMGDEYHVALFKQMNQRGGKDTEPLPPPLKFSKDPRLVELLRRAFRHLASLHFWDRPDYDLIYKCIQGFAGASYLDTPVRRIEWARPLENAVVALRNRPLWDVMDDGEQLNDELFDDVEDQNQRSTGNFMDRLPLQMRYYIAQMEHNSHQAEHVPPVIAMRDWVRVVIELLDKKEWDARRYEDGGHRTASDGYRRDNYCSLLEKCVECAELHQCFRAVASVYYNDNEKNSDGVCSKIDIAEIRHLLVYFSKTIAWLRGTLKAEKAKRPAPPMRISFG